MQKCDDLLGRACLHQFPLGTQACTLPSFPLIFLSWVLGCPPSSPHPPTSVSSSILPLETWPFDGRRTTSALPPSPVSTVPKGAHPPVHTPVTPEPLTRLGLGLGSDNLGAQHMALMQPSVPVWWPSGPTLLSAGSRGSKDSSLTLQFLSQSVQTWAQCANMHARAQQHPFSGPAEVPFSQLFVTSLIPGLSWAIHLSHS